MGIIKQTIICIIIGLTFMACEASDNRTIDNISNKVGMIVFKDYSISDIKETCISTYNNAKKLKEKAKSAMEYTEDTMANYRKDVV